jgi:NAD(P)-dependent dehydrogenase (short-subunit alcohol dehydrogenase family)
VSRLLDGRAVLVTGAGGGLGRAYALACAAEGARVVVQDVADASAGAVAAEIAAAGGEAIPVGGSVADWDDAAAMVARCVDAFGAIDGLVANAGVRHEALPWDETEAGLRRIAEVNVLGVQFTARHAMRAMVDAGRGGAVVTVVSGARLGLDGMSAYGASKGAVAGMTANWALEGARVGIRVNAVSPLALTPMALGDTRADRPPLPPAEGVAPVVPALLAADLTGWTIRFDGTRLQAYVPVTLAEAFEDRDGWDAVAVVDVLTGWEETR